MSFIAVAVGTAVVAPAVIQSNSAQSAAQKQQSASDRANTELRGVYDQTRKDYQPWQQAGTGALSQMQDPSFQKGFDAEAFGQNFTGDPGYQWRLAEGNKALERSAAARGNLQSGGFAKGLAKYNQGFASNEYNNAYNRAYGTFSNDQNNRFNRLSTIAGYGMNANNSLAGVGQNYGNQVASNIMGAGNAAGAADIAGGKAWSDTINGVTSGAFKLGGMALGGV